MQQVYDPITCIFGFWCLFSLASTLTRYPIGKYKSYPHEPCKLCPDTGVLAPLPTHDRVRRSSEVQSHFPEERIIIGKELGSMVHGYYKWDTKPDVPLSGKPKAQYDYFLQMANYAGKKGLDRAAATY